MMTENEAQAIADTLCKAFGIRKAKVRLSNRATRGYYDPRAKEIVVGNRCWRGVMNGLLHELAHHVHDCQEDRAYDRSANGRRQIHNPRFCKILNDVVVQAKADGIAEEYSWETEYRSVRKIAIARGWASAPTASVRTASKPPPLDILGSLFGP